jgi:hypothetical protein
MNVLFQEQPSVGYVDAVKRAADFMPRAELLNLDIRSPFRPIRVALELSNTIMPCSNEPGPQLRLCAVVSGDTLRAREDNSDDDYPVSELSENPCSILARSTTKDISTRPISRLQHPKLSAIRVIGHNYIRVLR